MNNQINGIIYKITVKLYWGSESTDVSSELKDNANVVTISDDKIESLDIVSSIVNPCFHGSIVYRDSRQSSDLRNCVDMPLLYGHIMFCAENGSDIIGVNSNIDKYGDEIFDEEIFVDSIKTYDDQKSDYIYVKIDFTSIDILKFISNISKISTYKKWDTNSDTFSNVIKNVFGAANLSDRIDSDSLTIDTKIPFISTPNQNLLSALDYIYRKVFDYSFEDTNNKVYCRMIYDHIKKKYKMWSFSDVGTKKNVDSKASESLEKINREKITIDSLIDQYTTTSDGSVSINNSGELGYLFNYFADNTFINFNYMKNEFKSYNTEKFYNMFVDHDDEFSDTVKNKYDLISNNGKYFKDNKYSNTFTSSRQNGSLYDSFSDTIFKTSFIRVESNGSIGRKAGDSVILTFNNKDSTIYENIEGDYLITGIDQHYEKKGENGKFVSIMDLYRPYAMSDSYKTTDAY